MAVKHSKVSAVPDGPDTSLVRPVDWNAVHTHEAEAANTILAGPASGPAAAPTFRAIVDGDIPAMHSGSAHHAAATASGAHTVSGQDVVAVAATDALAAHVELATAAEAAAGTDTGRVPPVSVLPALFQNSKYVYAAVVGGGTDDYAITLIPTPAAYARGQVFHFRANVANTGPATLNVNGLGAGTIKKHKDQDLATGDILAGQLITVIVDVEGSTFQMQSQLGQTPPASDTVSGHVELATIAETDTGTDATRAVTPDGLAGSNYGERAFGILVSDPNGDAVTVGDGKAYFRVPSSMNGFNLVEVGASLSTVSSSGIPTVQIRRSRRATATTRTNADMLSTKLTVDASEFDSEDAAAAAVIDAANDDVNTGDHIYIDIDVAGTGVKGLFVTFVFRLP